MTADSGDMHSGAPFAQILAEKVGRANSGGPAMGGPAGYGRPHDPVVLFFHTGVSQSVHAARVAGAYNTGFRTRAAAAAPAAPPPSRPARTLTDRQQQALAHMVAMGARLQRNFTDTELRSAFKMLARLYHPDRHPGTSEFESARLSRQFAALHEAYRQLLNLGPLPPAA